MQHRASDPLRLLPAVFLGALLVLPAAAGTPAGSTPVASAPVGSAPVGSALGTFELRATPPPGIAAPPLPPTSTYGVQLVLDDDSQEAAFGVQGGAGAVQFLWFNQFTRPVGVESFSLEEIWVLFPSGPNMAVGEAVELVVYLDDDGDPTNGATLLASYDETIQVVDDTTFSLYLLDPPVAIDGPGDVLIGVVSRFVTSGVTSVTNPASLDLTASQGRSWVGLWTGDPPEPPVLPPDAVIATIDQLVPGAAGNWMIRGFGNGTPVLAIPTLNPWGLGLLAAVLALGGAWLLRRRSGTGFGVCGTLLLLLATPAAQAQVPIDTFATAQGPLTAPPTSSSSVAGAGILGASRGLVVQRLSGAGSVTAEVTAGQLSLTVLAGDVGQVEITYDGDADPDTLSPTGLGGVDLSATGALRFTGTVASGMAGNQVDVEVEVFTDAGNSSKASALMPVGGPTDFFLAFSEFRIAEGAGADFSSVGALVVVIRAEDAAVSFDELLADVPNLAALKVDALTADVDMDGQADPGDTLTYTITITNTGGEALTVDLADTVDANTTLDAASVSATPIPKNDQYEGVGNVTLTVAGGPGRPGLVANDADPDGDTLTVTAIDSPSTRGATVTLTDPQGFFTYEPPASFSGVDSFTYTVEDDDGNTATGTAVVTTRGRILFVDNSSCAPFPCGSGSQADPYGTLEQAEMASQPNDVIRVREGDGTDSGHDLGFILKDGQRLVGGAADLLVGGDLIEAGAGPSVHSHGLGHVLELADDNVVEGLVINSSAATFHGVAGNGSANAVLDNVTIHPGGNAGAIRLTNHTGGFVFSSSAITAANATTGVGVQVMGGSGLFDFSGGSSIAVDGGGLIHVQNAPGAVFDFSGTNPTLTNGSAAGLLLENNAGATFTFTGLGPITTGAGHGIRMAATGIVNLNTVGAVDATGGAALDITGTTVVKTGGGAITFPSLRSVTSPTLGINLIGVTPPVTVSGTTAVMNGSAGVVLDGSGAATFSGALTVTTTAGVGLRANNTGLVTATAGGSTIVAAGGPGVDVISSPLNLSLATLSSSGSPGRGVSLQGASGNLTANAGTVTGTAGGTAFHVSGGNPVVTYGGDVTQNAAQRVVDVAGTTGGSVTFQTGTVTGGQNSLGVRIDNADGNASFADLDLGTLANPMGNTGLTLSGGSLGTFSFAGTQIFTNGAMGLNADNGGVIQVTGPGNRVSTTGATAVALLGGTTIGGAGVTFQRVDASGAARGIILNNAGSGFTITGSGPNGIDGSGGVIANMTQRGIEILGTDAVTLRNIDLNNAATTDSAGTCDNVSNVDCHAAVHLGGVTTAVLDNVDVAGSVQQGLNGVDVSALSLLNSEIFNAGDEVDEGCLRMFNLSGDSEIRSSDLAFPSERVALVENDTGNLNLVVNASTFRDTQSSGMGADGLELAFFANATATIDVENSVFRRNRTNGLQVISEDTTVIGIDITGSTFDREAGIGIGMDLAAADSGSLTFNVIGNPLINSNDGPAVNVFAIDTATVEGRINDNPNIRVGGAGTAGIGIRAQVNEDSRGILEISGNTINDIGNDAGIEVISRLKVGPACGTGCTAGRLDATINGNTVTVGAGSLYDVWVQANDSNTTCADVTDNSTSGAGIAAFRQRTNAAESTVILQGFMTDAATTWANNGNTPAGSVSSSNNGTLVGGSCVTVSHPLP